MNQIKLKMKQDPDSVIDQMEQLMDTKTELYKLKLTGKIAYVFSSVMTQLIFGLVAIIILLLLTFGLSFWLGERMGNSYMGFIMIAGGLSVLSVLFFIFRFRTIQKPLKDIMVSQLLKEKDNA
jgi:hypothetical protein